LFSPLPFISHYPTTTKGKNKSDGNQTILATYKNLKTSSPHYEIFFSEFQALFELKLLHAEFQGECHEIWEGYCNSPLLPAIHHHPKRIPICT